MPIEAVEGASAYDLTVRPASAAATAGPIDAVRAVTPDLLPLLLRREDKRDASGRVQERGVGARMYLHVKEGSLLAAIIQNGEGRTESLRIKLAAL